MVQSANPAGVAVVAITEDSDLEKTREHFAELGVVLQEVRPVEFSKIGVHGTPTLIVIDRNGKVKRSWAGELKPEDQKQVLSLISSSKDRPRSSVQKYLRHC